MSNILALMLLAARRWDEAIDQYRKTLEMDRNYVLVHRDLPLSYAAHGAFDKAVEHRLKYLALRDHDPATLDHLERTFRLYDIRCFWEEEVRAMQSQWSRSDWDTFEIAQIWARLRNTDAALKWLDVPYQARSGAIVWVNIFHDFDSLRDMPSFKRY